MVPSIARHKWIEVVSAGDVAFMLERIIKYNLQYSAKP